MVDDYILTLLRSNCDNMKYLIFLLILVGFMRTCRTIDNIQSRREELLTELKNDSLLRLHGHFPGENDYDTLLSVSPEPFSIIVVYNLPMDSRHVLHQ